MSEKLHPFDFYSSQMDKLNGFIEYYSQKENYDGLQVEQYKRKREKVLSELLEYLRDAIPDLSEYIKDTA